MKNLIKYIITLVVLGSNAAYAQKFSIDSPHNYKRPVFQQKKAMHQSSSVVVLSQSSSAYQFKNNINSVHNYKRKGVRDFASESALVVEMPIKNEIAFNPLLSSNNYKIHFVTTKFGKEMVANRELIQSIDNAKKKQSDSLSLN